MKILQIITDTVPEKCGECVIYLETPQLTVCGATHRLTLSNYGRPRWCPLLTHTDYQADLFEHQEDDEQNYDTWALTHGYS